MTGEPLRVTGSIEIPDDELVWRFHTTGGPGGQHANRSHTGVELSFDVTASRAFDDGVRSLLIERLGSRVRDGVVVVGAAESRSQWRNRQSARRRLANLLRDALREEKPRRPTRPSRTARIRRLEQKRARGEVKRLRRRPEAE